MPAVDGGQRLFQHGAVGFAGYPVGFQDPVVILFDARAQCLFFPGADVGAQPAFALFQQQPADTAGEDQRAGGCPQKKCGVGQRIDRQPADGCQGRGECADQNGQYRQGEITGVDVLADLPQHQSEDEHATGGVFIFGLVLGQIRKHVYARYFALSVLAILVGALTTSLTTIGWLPVNPLTDSAFFLGAAAGSLILTSGVGRLLLEERKRRLSADIRAREEQALRARIEQDYDRVLKTHRVTGKPNRPMLE